MKNIIYKNEKLSKYSWFNLGGPAEVLFKPNSIEELKNFLVNLADTEFVRMTGSGSAIIAYFSSVKMCKEAEKKVKNQFRNYWCKTSKTI